MKSLIIFATAAIVAATVAPVEAAIFRPETVRGAVLGGVAGAVIGHNDGRHGWEGAAYGTLAGGLIGSAMGNARDRSDLHPVSVARSHPVGVRWSSGPRWHVGYTSYRGSPGWRHHGFRGYRHGYRHPHYNTHFGFGPTWGSWSHPVPYRPYRSSGWYGSGSYRDGYAARGALLGGVLGAVVGHNQGRRGWEGAAIGAGAGYLFGSAADARARQEAAAREIASQSAAAQRSSAAAAPAPAQVTIINNYYSRDAAPMSGANSLFGR